MHITTIALIIAIIGLLSSSVLVGGLISLVSLIMGIISLRQEKTIDAVRVIAISVAGIVVPFIMYFNTYGISFPSKNGSDSAYKEILTTNYTNMGIALAGDKAYEGNSAVYQETASEELNDAIAKAGDQSGFENEIHEYVMGDDKKSKSRSDQIENLDDGSDSASDGENSGTEGTDADEIVYVGIADTFKRGILEHSEKDLFSQDTAGQGGGSDAGKNNASSGKKATDGETETEDKKTIFESLDSMSESDKNKGGIISIAPKDDDMPSYGGLPVGTLIIAQYFREDDHNCNPVLVMQNKTGETVRYECKFIARDGDGNALATSEKTVEVVKNGSLFVFEGRFDKREMGNKTPSSYEFSITKRTPYEKDMASDVSVYTSTDGSAAIVTAVNNSDKKVKVDAYILFFDGTEMVDCMWMIPQNTDEVCLGPGTKASIQGDAYYRFDRVETYYTAYEAIEAGE